MPESCISNNFPVGNTSNKWLVTFIAHIQMAKSNFPVFWLHVKNRACMEIAKDGIYKSLDKDQYFHLTYLWWCFPLKWKFANIMLNKTVIFSKLQRIIWNFVAYTIKCAVCAEKRMLCKWFDVKKFKNRFVCLGLNGKHRTKCKGTYNDERTPWQGPDSSCHTDVKTRTFCSREKLILLVVCLQIKHVKHTNEIWIWCYLYAY